MFGASLELGAWSLELLFKFLSWEKARLACRWNGLLSVRPNVPQQIYPARRQVQVGRRSSKLSRAGTATVTPPKFGRLRRDCKVLRPAARLWRDPWRV